MKKVDVFLKGIEGLKVGMNKSTKNLTEDAKVIILERKQKEFERKVAQIQEEIEREVEDFFEYLNIKQANIETLNSMNVYIEDELKKIGQLIDNIKVAKGE